LLYTNKEAYISIIINDSLVDEKKNKKCVHDNNVFKLILIDRQTEEINENGNNQMWLFECASIQKKHGPYNADKLKMGMYF
jgi:hypothetical protein